MLTEASVKFPVGSYVVLHGRSWNKEDHPFSWWMKGRHAVVTGHHEEREHDENGEVHFTGNITVEIALTKPDGDKILNLLVSDEEIEFGESQRTTWWWE